MGFQEHLARVCKGVDGAVACALMGVDGIEVDSHVREGGDLDVKSLLVEYSAVLRGAREAAQAHEAGGVAELAIATERLVALVRAVSPEYFVVVALEPGGNFGKARYLLRVTAPRLLSEL